MAAESKPAKRVSGASAREFEGVIKSAKRVLELFEYFAECRRPLSVTDLVRGLDYPQSSASVLLKSLTRLGYLDYDRQKRLYRPTLRVALLGGWVHDQLFSHASLSHLIDDLHLVSGGEAVILGMQNDIYVQYIHLVQSRHQQVASWYIKPGSLRPTTSAASVPPTMAMRLLTATSPLILSIIWALMTLKPNHPTMRIHEPSARKGMLEGGWADMAPSLR